MWSTNRCHASRALPLLLAVAAFAATPTIEIKVDQAGYLPDAPKVAMVVSKNASGDFTVRNSATNAAVFRGKLGAAANDADSGDRVQTADFSKLAKSGKYYLEVAGVGRSWDFEIARTSTRALTISRCVPITASAAASRSIWAPNSRATNTTPAISKAPTTRRPARPGRACLQGRLARRRGLWPLRSELRHHHRHAALGLGDVPPPRASEPAHSRESGNGTPDILNEIRWNLDWMLTMQDDDGGVWHKQTSEKFCALHHAGEGRPGELRHRHGQRAFKSSCATGDFAAVVAIARAGLSSHTMRHSRRNACARRGRRWRGWPSVSRT